VTARVKRQSPARWPARKTPVRRPQASIDPRIRDRRVAVTRAQGRRRLHALVALLVLAILGAVAWLVTHSALLDVDRVRVTATQHVTAADVRHASGVRLGEPLLFLDLGAVERRIERLPWVDQARADRRLSGEVDLHVTERAPAAWARRTADVVALVDAHGRVLADAPEPPGELAELSGLAKIPPPGGQITPRAAAQALEKLPDELHGRVTRVGASGEGVVLALRDGPEVRLGPPDHVPDKTRAALAVLGTITGPPPAYVDVRVPTAPVTG
jgi:cell division protein FtsQ